MMINRIQNQTYRQYNLQNKPFERSSSGFSINQAAATPSIAVIDEDVRRIETEIRDANFILESMKFMLYNMRQQARVSYMSQMHYKSSPYRVSPIIDISAF